MVGADETGWQDALPTRLTAPCIKYISYPKGNSGNEEAPVSLFNHISKGISLDAPRESIGN